jgi:hypothetical protein
MVYCRCIPTKRRDMPDMPPTPIPIEHGPMLTLPEVARLTGRSLRLVQRWAQDGGILPTTFSTTKGHRQKLVKLIDLEKVATRKRKGHRTTRKTLRTQAGRMVAVRVETPTDSESE